MTKNPTDSGDNKKVNENFGRNEVALNIKCDTNSCEAIQPIKYHIAEGLDHGRIIYFFTFEKKNTMNILPQSHNVQLILSLKYLAAVRCRSDLHQEVGSSTLSCLKVYRYRYIHI
jgi:hypothetical protein